MALNRLSCERLTINELESKLRSELHPTADVSVDRLRSKELRMIEHVERFQPQLNGLHFAQLQRDAVPGVPSALLLNSAVLKYDCPFRGLELVHITKRGLFESTEINKSIAASAE